MTDPSSGLHGSVDTFKALAYGRPRPEETSRHLAAVYGIEVAALSELDGGVHRVDRRDGPPWVARVFSRARPTATTEGDAVILKILAGQDFPAERPAHSEPVSVLKGHAVLVTELIPGSNARSDTSPETLGDLAVLLGRLHRLPCGTGPMARPAGSWHSLSPAGGGRREDIRALIALLADARARASEGNSAALIELASELEAIDLCEDLPSAFSHPDFGPANTIRCPDGSLALVDWTGAGRVPRVLALGPLLWSAGTRSEAITAIADGYQKYQHLTETELDRLVDALRVFMMVLDCWGIVCWGTNPSKVLARARRSRERAVDIAEAASASFRRAPRVGGPG